MIKFNDLKNGLTKILSSNFAGHTVYTEEIKQGIKRPAFHINIIPLTSNNFNVYYREQQAMVDIAYFSDEKPDLQSNMKNFEMANALETALNTDIKVLDRNLNLQELEFDTVDRVLHTTFTLMWYNENEVTKAFIESHQVMERFTIDIVGGCIEYIVTSDAEVYKSSDGDFYVLCTDAEIEMLRDRNMIKI